VLRNRIVAVGSPGFSSYDLTASVVAWRVLMKDSHSRTELSRSAPSRYKVEFQVHHRTLTDVTVFVFRRGEASADPGRVQTR
jgi:hypothetical protein